MPMTPPTDDEDFLCKAIGPGKLRVAQQFVAGDDAGQVESWNRRSGRKRTRSRSKYFLHEGFLPLGLIVHQFLPKMEAEFIEKIYLICLDKLFDSTAHAW
mgnify:CR=1 FL=1